MGCSLTTDTEIWMCCVPRTSRYVIGYRSASLQWLQLLFMCLC